MKEITRGLVNHLAAGMGRGTELTRQGLAPEPPLPTTEDAELPDPLPLGRPMLRPSTVPIRFNGRITKATMANTASIVRNGSTREVW